MVMYDDEAFGSTDNSTTQDRCRRDSNLVYLTFKHMVDANRDVGVVEHEGEEVLDVVVSFKKLLDKQFSIQSYLTGRANLEVSIVKRSRIGVRYIHLSELNLEAFGFSNDVVSLEMFLIHPIVI